MCPPEVLNQDLRGRRVIVTAANSGIGFVTAKQLAKQGASVTLACRNEGEGSDGFETKIGVTMTQAQS